MKASPVLIGAWGAGAAAVAVFTTVLIVRSRQEDPPPGLPAAPAGGTAALPGSAPAPREPDPAASETSTRPFFAKLQPAATNPARCAAVRKRAGELLAEFEKKVSAADRQGAIEVLKEGAVRGHSQAEGYNLFAGGEVLKGNFPAAAWGALKAAALEWNATFAANAGVYLSHLGRLDEAESFLGCAGEMDPRSPFVIEAQAMLALRRNDCGRARERIELAVRLLPGDMNVRYSAGFIHYKCGDRGKALYFLRAAEREKPDDEVLKEAIRVVDPSSANRPRQRDALDLLVEECLAFLDEMVARAELTSDYHNEMDRQLSAGTSEGQDFAENLRENVRRNKEAIQLELGDVRDVNRGPAEPNDWNDTVTKCVEAYIEAICDYESMSPGLGGFGIMSAAMGMDPLVYCGKYRGTRDVDFVLLDEDDKFEEALQPLDHRLGACLNRARSPAESDACYRQCCGDAVPLWQAYRDAASRHMVAAEAGFPRAAEDYGNYWLAWVERGADYSARALKVLKPTPGAPESRAQSAEWIVKVTDLRLDSVTQFTSMKLSSTYESLQVALREGPAAVLHGANGHDAFRLCQQGRLNDVPIDPPIDPFLAALQEATTVEYGPTFFDCEAKAGNFGVQLKSKGGGDLQVKVSEKVGNVSYGASVGTGGRVGGEVSYSQSGSSHGVAAKGTVKIWGEARPGGRVDYGAQVEGKLGAGVTYGGQGVACYFVSGRATFNARVFAARLGG